VTYSLDVLVQGYPGKSTHHGGLGWATVSLLRGHGETLIVDTGGYGYRPLLTDRLGEHGLKPDDVTGVLVTHLHWDHVCNYTLFPKARVYLPAADLDWAVEQPVGYWALPEFHVEHLAREERVERLQEGDEFLPDLRALATPGHTPGHMAYVAVGDKGELIFAGDAVKNQAELMTERADMTLDAAASAASIRRIRGAVAADPENTLLCGHDRLLGIEGGRVVYKSGLNAAIAARFTTDFDRETTIDLVAD
jgi:glyoxylase-like metal-dependent hydrolase (beta-lactamase superfamily II)